MTSLDEQEFPDNSLLNGDNVDSIWLEEQNFIDTNSGTAQQKQQQFNHTSNHPAFGVSTVSLGGNLLAGEDAGKGTSFEDVLPDDLTQETEVVEQNDALQQEYNDLIEINRIFSKVNENLDQTRNKLRRFTSTVEQTDKLLDLWINILSQSVHTQHVLSDPSWEGMTTERKRIVEEEERERERQEREHEEREREEREERERQAAMERVREAEVERIANRPKIKRVHVSRTGTKSRSRRR
ncbi:hypothetical protein G9A89_007229 [Geosiphon pyriformis]|nr:hypothetical protein G9A89_007229 [Geosiphon pyriformis]